MASADAAQKIFFLENKMDLLLFIKYPSLGLFFFSFSDIHHHLIEDETEKQNN